MKKLKLILLVLACISINLSIEAQNYKNFKCAIYCRAYEVNKMSDANWLKNAWDSISMQVHVDKIYLETHRDLLTVDEKTLETAIRFFKGKGLEVSGGITYTINESNNFETFCYSNPEHRQKVKEIAELTARHFDEFILDDFFFTNCKCDLCIAAKGNKSWTDYRVELMKEAAADLVINPAKAVNPKVKVIIKYPNWYEHFQGLGFNLKDQPPLFDGIYTGTETRDPSSNQHLQQYESYAVFRYFENIQPGKNDGGWVDTGGLRYIDRYAEQLWLTLFAKAPQITLFDIRQMLYPLNEDLRPSWQGIFNFEEMKKPIWLKDGRMFAPSQMARAAGYSLEIVDKVLGKLGNPIGVKSYKPFHSLGEDFLQNYFGMIGIPIEMVPEFPQNESVVLLTETATFDPDIVSKIKAQLKRGGNVVVTSGFYKAMQGRGIEDIVELRVTDRKANVKTFSTGREVSSSENEILIPQINYLTNDSWEIISALDNTNGWPVLHSADYSKGKFYVWTIPDNFVDLYNLPELVLNRLRQVVGGDLGVRLEGPAKISLFVYDNHSFVVHSFLDQEVSVKILLEEKCNEITDVASGEKISGTLRKFPGLVTKKNEGDKKIFEIKIKPHSFRAFIF